MKVINSRGRTLLEVVSAFTRTAEQAAFDGGGLTLYRYTGDGFGGYTDVAGIQRQIEIVKSYAKSATVVGTLPEPKIGE